MCGAGEGLAGYCKEVEEMHRQGGFEELRDIGGPIFSSAALRITNLLAVASMPLVEHGNHALHAGCIGGQDYCADMRVLFGDPLTLVSAKKANNQ